MRRRLLRWFGRHARELPWRSDPTPYRVWVSEIMLQQTQVATVLPYFERFLRTFPDVVSLAESDEQTLLSHWEGLGYYRRARSMHAAAKQVVEKHGGEFPTTFDEVIALPGIGRYTAGAILSISQQSALPILEGNTLRVFSRWIALRGVAPVDKEANRLLWLLAEKMLPRKRPGDFNQASMELGALVCTPTQPACDACPVTDLCGTNARGLQAEIPVKAVKTKYEDRTEFALVIAGEADDSDRYLLRQIPPGRRWAGLWDFPRSTEANLHSLDEAAKLIGKEIGVAVHPGQRLTTIKHAVTRFKISLHVHEANFGSVSEKDLAPWRFCSLQEIEDLPLSVTGRRIAKLLPAKNA
ncbi:MAG: A/G-specific adenine glycosylase [Planctomycetota bacterium]